MRTALITLPVAHTDALDVLKHELLHTWGGYTQTLGQGAWLSPFDGKVYEEAVHVFSIAADVRGAMHTYDNARLHEIAREVGRLANQDAMYIQDFSGEVTILDTRRKVA